MSSTQEKARKEKEYWDEQIEISKKRYQKMKTLSPASPEWHRLLDEATFQTLTNLTRRF